MKYEKLSEHCEVFSGYAFKSQDLLTEGDIPVVKIGNISNGKDVILDNDTQYVDKRLLSINEKYHIRKGDVLISLTGSHINQPNSMVGRSCRYYQNQELLLNQRAGKVLAKDNNDLSFLYYMFSSWAMKINITNRAYGAANQANVSPTDISNIKFNFPEYEIQKKIGHILSCYDESIENNNKRIKLLEQMAQNLYKEWFVRFRFPDWQKAEFENGIPKGWKVKQLKDFGRIETGKTPSMEDEENYGNDFLFIKTPDLHKSMFVFDTEEKLSEKGHKSQISKLLPKNSIMVSCIGTAGIVSINMKEGHTNQQINSIILNDITELEWLFYTCKSLKETIELFGATGATMTNLSKGKFEKLKFIYPEKDILTKYHRITKPIFDEIQRLLIINQNLAKQRDLLLPRLMSGKLEVK